MLQVVSRSTPALHLRVRNTPASGFAEPDRAVGGRLEQEGLDGFSDDS